MRIRTAIVLFLLGVLVGPAFANIGVPMVAVFLPPLWLALVPVIVVESWVLVRLLPLSPARALTGSTVGNVLSTLVGVPFMWMALATVQLTFAGAELGLATAATRIYAVTVQAPWLIPYEEDLQWMIPAALAVLALPAYALSVFIEWRSLLPFLSSSSRPHALRAVALANVASYALLALLFIVTLRAQECLRPTFAVFSPITNWFVESVFAFTQTVLGVSPK